MKPLREWDWVPHLLVSYLVLFVLWAVAAGTGGLLLYLDAHAPRDAPGASLPLLNQAVAIASLTFAWAVLPLVAAVLTVRVILNERRWRREGDSRGR